MFNPAVSEESKILIKSSIKKKKMKGLGKVNVYFNRKKSGEGTTTYYSGNYFSEKTKTTMIYRSSYELKHFIDLEQDTNVLSFYSEIMEVPYKDCKGKNRKYIPDLIVIFKNGDVEVHEIKPTAMLADIDVQKKAQACRISAAKTFEQKVKYRFITEVDLFKTNKEYLDFINNVAKKWNKK